ncbi:MAG: cell division protein ZapA [Alphaproteobacteria bacterium]
MAQVTVQVNGREYKLACDDGQEGHLSTLASYVDERVREIAQGAGHHVSDAQLLLMGALLVADELAETYDELETVRTALEAGASGAADEAAAALDGLTARLERLSATLADGQSRA